MRSVMDAKAGEGRLALAQAALWHLAPSPAILAIAGTQFLLLAVGSTAGTGPSVSAAIFLTVLGYWPAAAVFHRSTVAPDLTETLVYLVTGWAWLATLSLLASAAGFSPL